jgi:cation diffusion facilitator family transporter
MTVSRLETAENEKRRAAFSSVVAAVLLTALKLIVGLLTGSLGILSEAAHSGLDLVAALVTFFAVRVSDRPPDANHPYGHGKVENLSALVETLLLLATCVWIIYEVIQRLQVSRG